MTEMDRAGGAGRREVRDLIASLDRISINGDNFWPEFPTRLGRLLNAQLGLFYSLSKPDGKLHIAKVHGWGAMEGQFREAIRRLLAAGTRGTHYDPQCSDPRQANRAFLMQELMKRSPVDKTIGQNAETICNETLGLYRVDQVRVLVCEGSSILGWVGALRAGSPFTQREKRLLQCLTPALTARLSFEKRLGERGLYEASLQTALEALEAPAYFVDSSGRTLLANNLGKLDWDRMGKDVRERIRLALNGDQSEFRSIPVVGRCLPNQFLLVAHGRSSNAGSRLSQVGAAWGLTLREQQVLGLLLRGLGNDDIARELSCAVRTIEVHMTHVMKKAGVESRLALVVAVWRGIS